MKIDPIYTFWLGLITTILHGITSGTVHLTGIVPEAYMNTVTAWIGLIVFINMSLMTALTGFSSAKSGPLAPPPTVPEAQAVMAQAKKAESIDKAQNS
jgi:hypothetical protein